MCSNCKCTIVEKPVQKKEEKKKDQCVATIVGVLQLPENFCCNQPKPEEKKEDDGGQEEVSILFLFIFIAFTKSRQKLELGRKYVLIFDFLFFAFFWLLNFFCLWVSQKQCWLCYLMTGYLLKNRCNFFFSQEECVDIYRDLGECLQKCIVQSSKGGKQKNGGLECDIGTCGSNGSSKSSKSKNGWWSLDGLFVILSYHYYLYVLNTFDE